ncbi:MAG: RNase III inhibitor, partial [Candidatus Faecousia sp.]|nr:RNase III inhibitor [Candidatus Faecousia sp.]
DRESFRLSRQRHREVASFIDDNYIQEKTAQQISPGHVRSERVLRDRDALDDICAPMECAEPALPRTGRKSIPLPYAKPKPSLADLLAETDAGFSETLLKLIDRTGKKDSEIYTKANLSRQHFSKIRNNPHYQPTKPTAIALALALELDLDQTRDLIGRAGYALTNSSKFDVIIMYFIREKNYNLFDINAALFEFDQSLLGG